MTALKKVLVLFRLIRIKQWIKNGFIFMPLIFSGLFFVPSNVVRTGITFSAFCFLSSCIYIFNDLCDINSDRLHPLKKNRPLAAGLISKKTAIVVLVVFLLAALFLCRLIASKPLIFIMLSYIVLHVFYSIGLKRAVILDAMLIALGFELRIWAGSVVLAIAPSVWLQLCVFLLTLFLGFTKRRHEKMTLSDKAAEHRSVLARYPVYFLDQMIVISATLSIVFYCLYAFSGETAGQTGHSRIIYTIPFVVYGIFRYIYLIYVKKLGGEPGDAIVLDVPFAINLFLWLATTMIILYFF